MIYQFNDATFTYIRQYGQGHMVDVSRNNSTVRFIASDAQGIEWRRAGRWNSDAKAAHALGFSDESDMWNGLAYGLCECVLPHTPIMTFQPFQPSLPWSQGVM